MRTETVLPLAAQSMSFRAWMMFLRACSLFRGGHRVFEVEEDVVGGAGGSLVDHRGVRAGDGEFRALEAGFAEGVEGVAHGVTRPPCGQVRRFRRNGPARAATPDPNATR